MLRNRLWNDIIENNNAINYLDLKSHFDDVRGVRTTVKSRQTRPARSKQQKWHK